MKRVFYEKRGRRYYPVSEHDSDLLDSFPKGAHLVCCYPGGKSTRFNINPDYAAMIAAGRVAEEKMLESLLAASAARLEKPTPLTPEQQAAWENLIKVLGDQGRALTYDSAADVVRAGVAAMQEKADLLLKNPGVKLAWDHFMTVCKLASEEWPK